MYGEWRPKWAGNGNDFDIDILSFGYGDQRNVGNPHPHARTNFSYAEKLVVMGLIRHLFNNERPIGIAPFTSRKARYLGHVFFATGWIVCR